MKKKFGIVFLISTLIAFVSFSQKTKEFNDSSVFLIKTMNEVIIYNDDNDSKLFNYSYIPKGKEIFAYAFLPFKNENKNDSCFRVLIDNYDGYIINDTNNLVYIESGKKYLASKGHDGFYERYLVAKDFLVISKKLKLLEVKKNTQSIGLAILDWKWSIKNEFSNFADFKIEILNPTNKIVKYLWFNISAYDAVDGLLFNSGKSIVSLKGIGPIGSNEISSYAFDKVFYSPVIHKMKIRSIKIQYMDGSIKIITDVSKIIIKV